EKMEQGLVRKLEDGLKQYQAESQRKIDSLLEQRKKGLKDQGIHNRELRAEMQQFKDELLSNQRTFEAKFKQDQERFLNSILDRLNRESLDRRAVKSSLDALSVGLASLKDQSATQFARYDDQLRQHATQIQG